MKRDVFQAIADPTRRNILMLISNQTMTPKALSEHFDTSRQAVSKHIKILSQCQLLYQKKMGREIFYYINDSKMREIDIWLEKLRLNIENRFKQLDEVLNHLKTTNHEK